jgi:protein involved in polysaccharide export with SLBB domain
MHSLRPVVFLFLALLCSTLVTADAVAQSSPGGPRTPATVFGGSSTPRRPTSSTFGGELPPVEKPIDPELYRLGPNDQLIVTIPALEELSMGGEFPVVVSADNIVALPRGVTINARGMTLAQFRRTATSAFEKRSSALDVSSVVLVRPRSVYVTVRGDVLKAGRHIVTAADRVSTAIDVANAIEPGTTDADLAKIVEQQNGRTSNSNARTGSLALSEMPRRNIIVRHNDGTSSRVDLARFVAYGTDADNPTLREGDEIIVGPLDGAAATVAVGGAVNSPMVVEWRRGDNASMLLKLGAGLKTSGDVRNAFISRSTATGTEKIPVDITDSAALAAITLEPGDQLIIPATETRTGSRAGIVFVEGAVGQPSAYPVVSGETKLTEVIEMAGGFGTDAAINGAYIVRESDPTNLEMRSQINEQIATIATSDLTLEDTTRVKMDLQTERDRVSADFVGLFLRGDRSKDISLRSGDRIVVPTNPRSVYVFGRVVYSGAVDYREGADIDYYLARAGGLSQTAARDRIQVIKFGTGRPLAVTETAIEPGDRIYVAGERDYPARTPLEITATWLGITGSILAITYTVMNIIDLLQRMNAR